MGLGRAGQRSVSEFVSRCPRRVLFLVQLLASELQASCVPQNCQPSAHFGWARLSSSIFKTDEETYVFNIGIIYHRRSHEAWFLKH